MKLIIDRLAPVLGPKITGLLTGVTTLYAQASSGFSESSAGPAIMDFLSTALATGDYLSLLPAPIAAAIGFIARNSEKPTPAAKVNDVAIMAERTAQIVPDYSLDDEEEDHETSSDDVLWIEQNERMTDISNHASSNSRQIGRLEDKMEKVESLETVVKQLRTDVGNLKNAVNSLEQGNSPTGAMKSSIATQNRLIQDNRRNIKQLFERMNELEDNGTLAGAIPATSYDPDATGEGELIEIRTDPKMTVSRPVNERQNNPGNIEATVEGKTRWKGEIDSDNRYANFKDTSYGGRAMLYLLLKVYYRRHGLQSVHDIIHRWAPLGDNSEASVTNYINFVSDKIGVSPRQDLNLPINTSLLLRMAAAMSEFEGGKPFPMTDTQWAEAYERLVE